MGYSGMHAIEFVDDDKLPVGHDFMFVVVPGGGLIFYRESALSPEPLEDSWSAYRALSADDPRAPTSARPSVDEVQSILSLVASA